MNKQNVLVKLAQVRLAINHVLRQRMTKRATLDNTPCIPQWSYNPYNNGNEYYMDDADGRRWYYRSGQDLMDYANNPGIPTRQGTYSDLPAGSTPYYESSIGGFKYPEFIQEPSMSQKALEAPTEKPISVAPALINPNRSNRASTNNNYEQKILNKALQGK